jgi:hypothetical protein
MDCLSGPQFAGTIDFELLADMGMSAAEYARYTGENDVRTDIEVPESRKRRRSPEPEVISTPAVKGATSTMSRSTVESRRHQPIPDSSSQLEPLHAESCESTQAEAPLSVPVESESEFEREALVSQICGALAEENRLSVTLAVQALGLASARKLRDETLTVEVRDVVQC